MHKDFDASGAWASQGMVLPELLKQLLADPFFALASPKSIGKEYFSLSWLHSYLDSAYKLKTFRQLCSCSRLKVLQRRFAAHTGLQAVYLCGGGTHNSYLQQNIQQLIPTIPVHSVDYAGFSPDYLEAMMCAWLHSNMLRGWHWIYLLLPVLQDQ